MTKHMNRRIFLRGLGGAIVAAPFLSSIAERAAKAQSMPAAARAEAPDRDVHALRLHHEQVVSHEEPRRLTADDLMPTTLAPLAPYASKLLMPRGIRSMNEWTAQHGARAGQRLAHADRGLVLHLPAGHSEQQRPVQLRTGDEVQRQAGRSFAGSRHGPAAQPERHPAAPEHGRPERQRRSRRSRTPPPRRRSRASTRRRPSAASRASSSRARRCRRTPTRRFAARASSTSCATISTRSSAST